MVSSHNHLVNFDKNLSLIDYHYSLSEMPSTLTGQWFAERWNMWLKGTVENLIQKNTDSSFDSLDTTILNLREWTEKKYVNERLELDSPSPRSMDRGESVASN